MFDLFKKTKKIISPMSGRTIPIEEVNDEVFSQKMLGTGIAIIPNEGKLCAPFDAEVVQIFETRHSYILRADDGLEALIHIGINTVELAGEGFESYVKEHQKVNAGEVLGTVNLDLLKKKGYCEQSPIIFVNGDTFKFDFKYLDVKAGKTLIVNYCRK
ncbi:MAG: PTS glucose transporter subunit IIA [Oscillospiraceae bacterium]|nr:PTS glucose transporter subunit IIA [Oscillospiraceae bacterium]